MPLAQGQTLEQALDHAITIGAEDVTGNFVFDTRLSFNTMLIPHLFLVEEDGSFCFISSPSDFYKVQGALKQLGYSTIESDLEYFPLARVCLNEADMIAAAKLYEKLEEEPDVVKIHDNIE